MVLSPTPEWQPLALYALGGALLLILLFNLPYIGRAIRALFTLGLMALCLFLVIRHAPFDPTLSGITRWLGIEQQSVVGREVRIPMARDGHFWARVSLNGTERRMLIDSGATITAISAETADAAGIAREENPVPVILQTANGSVEAATGRIDRLTLGGITATRLPVVISPALGRVDVIGMNFLSDLQSWRVEGRTLILVPRPAEPA
ncbi:retropepsin-like aspartic protease [Sphingomonas sp. BGYR3]|uniref:retropepsin-like aspartic protease family protein n=1 Tax=Sphingomonas sp. BGYR3 TaxID=2975483 RepID=UPI0021A7E04E|nr:retropepsin-like aspartic protease [Sphingomonas sp. BGYR3]MDG5489370.1 retropepsin-like aspartic protease [Sphingomonas sp. BGYR3]